MKQTTLILGAGGCGKTLLAKKLAQGVPCKFITESESKNGFKHPVGVKMIVIDEACDLEYVKSLISTVEGPDLVITSNFFKAKDFRPRRGLQVINLKFRGNAG